MALEPGRGILAHRFADGRLHAYVALKQPEAWFAAVDFGDREAALARFAAQYEGWAPALTALITESDADPLLRGIYALPVVHRWDRAAA